MNRKATLIADLGFGDAGKGSIVDFLARESDSPVVVRYNGGPQAAHNVVTPDGRHHTFTQFGSGSFVPRVRTHLSRHMLINPFNAFIEARQLLELGVDDIWLRTSFDEDALVVTPFHVAANQLRELSRGDGRHGSCGQGIGETRSLDIRHPELSIHIRDLFNINRLFKQLVRIQGALREDSKVLWERIASSDQAKAAMHLLSDPKLVWGMYSAYRQFTRVAHIADTDFLTMLSKAHEHIIFEGAQGVLLDEKYGFHPHTTWSNTTYHNAFQILDDIEYDGEVSRLGLIRGYATRHGAGPFVTEDPTLTADIPDYHNAGNLWQREFRIGQPDIVSIRYGIEAAGGVDELVVTNLDRMIGRSGWQLADSYQLGKPPTRNDLFDFDHAGHVERIRFKLAKDLERQESITNSLLQARPVYQELQTASGRGIMATEEDVEMYLGTLTQKLEIPITLTSSGPTESGKSRLIPANK